MYNQFKYIIMGTTYGNFKEYYLYPALFENLDRAFPLMEFKKVGSRWESKHHLDGTLDSQHKAVTFVYANAKFCAKDHSKDKSRGLIDLFIDLNGTDFKTTIKSLADICSLSVPEEYSKEWDKYEKLQENREAAEAAFKSALWSGTAEAEKVLSYLRDVRKWTDSEIKEAGLGLITPEVLETLPDSASYKVKGVGQSHKLVIPYRNGSRLFGFKFRAVEDVPELPKYLNSYGLQKSRGFFNIGIGVKDLVIVEGEMDALHAKVKGLGNVAATTGGRASAEQIKDAVERGVEKFTLLFDNDERGRAFIVPTIEAIKETGKSIYVAALPDGKDTDEFLSSHSVEEFNKIIAEAPSYTTFLFWNIVDKFTKREQAAGEATIKDREDFFTDVERLVNSPYVKPYERQDIFKLLGAEAVEKSLNYKITDYIEWADNSYLREEARRRAERVRKASADISRAVEQGRTDEALKMMKETSTTQAMTDRATEYAKVFTPTSAEEYNSYLGEIKEGIPTGYTFIQGKHEEKLTLNEGLTFICGYRGHGKTSFLNNIALNEAKRNVALKNGKSVLYFSYEVAKRRLLIDLLNTFVNDTKISRSPADTIQGYFKGKGDKYFRRDRREDGFLPYENFIKQKDIFFRDYLSSSALVVVEESYKAEELLRAIKWYMTAHEVSIVCIDYAQLLYSEDYTRQRTEEIKKIVTDIKDFANKEGVPFVMAAQFNREVDSPISVDTKNIGEAGDLERIADTAIGIFNLKELHPLPKNHEEEKAAKKLLEDMGAATYSSSDNLKPIENKIFVRLLKRRYGYYPLDIILDWEGRTKYIAQNSPEDMGGTAEAENKELPF